MRGVVLEDGRNFDHNIVSAAEPAYLAKVVSTRKNIKGGQGKWGIMFGRRPAAANDL
jgi:hypothetical protein